jgi:hypothetical protein
MDKPEEIPNNKFHAFMNSVDAAEDLLTSSFKGTSGKGACVSRDLIEASPLFDHLTTAVPG